MFQIVNGYYREALSPTTKAAESASLYQFFGPGGLLSRTHPAYEYRRGQLDMANAVEEALRDRRHLIVEAGTGTGKTLAYLVPVLRSSKRVVISTATKALQEQLFYKDVPFLEEAIGRPLAVCYMKGRNNYLCRKKLYDITGQAVLSGLDEIDHYRAIVEWEKQTTTGDRAELAKLPENSPLWTRIDARTEACIGERCKEFERCFITEMRRRALESDIIIVNHHLFFADLAIKQAKENGDGGVLPDFGAVIFDEAHELEEVAGSYFGVSVGNLRYEDLAREVENTLKQKNLLSASILAATARVRERANLFFSLLPAGDGRFAFRDRDGFLEEHGDVYESLRDAVAALQADLNIISPKPDEVFSFVRRCDELNVQLSFVLESKDRNTVFWIERRGPAARSGRDRRSQGRAEAASRFVFVQATPIDISQLLRLKLFEQLESVVLTSATLAVDGGFQYIRGRLGLDHARELVVPSHFNYETQAMLYVPPQMPDPRSPEFTRQASEIIRQVLELSHGRAFCLFTSYAQMFEIHDRLSFELDFPLLLQGTAPKNALLKEFRSTPNAVLFATSSFWQGVDVQGDQLSCVIIDRLPFAVPSDPVVAARVNSVNESGGNAFFDYQVPAAVIALKQGFGRLIRSLNDRGVLVLLDNRIVKQRYGRVFLNSLPRYSSASTLDDVREFFQ
jgi:ATP-dependent DNA helicase DinG